MTLGSPPGLARWGHGPFGLAGRLTPAVKLLLVANVAMFIVQGLGDAILGEPGGSLASARPVTFWLGLVPLEFVKGALWQPLTYMFLHGGVWHLALNMLGLWVFGGDCEERLGTAGFLKFYVLAGLVAGGCAVLFGWGTRYPVVGASGAVFAVLMAFATFYPYRPITLLVFFVIPVTLQARVLVAVFTGIEVLTLLSGGAAGLGNLAHLGGLAFGWAYLRWPEWGGKFRSAGATRRAERGARFVARARDEERRLQEEMDGLLSKISRSGMEGLSETERRRLHEIAERMREL